MARNATAAAFNQSQDYFTVLDEVTKLNVQLNTAERLWAVRDLPRRPFAEQEPQTDT